VVPGTWKIQVRAYTGTDVLRAVNETAEVNVSAGGNALIKMVTATEVTNWADLKIAAAGAIPTTMPPTPSDRAEVIYWTGSNESFTGNTIDIQRKVTIIAGGGFTITKSSTGASLLVVHTNGRLTLKGNGLILDGNLLSDNASLIWVNGGTLILDGPTLRRNESNEGGGVSVGSNGAFIMESGTISNNTATSTTTGGGGVLVDGGSTFIMNSGTISGNNANGGGGVGVMDGTFTMNSGAISNNTGASGSGGVGIAAGSTFTMNSGSISDNNVTNMGGAGGGVGANGTFTMYSGSISDNNVTGAVGDAGGVIVFGNFTMYGGSISDNTVTNNGGGVYVANGGTFTLEDGEIGGNAASSYGGGVYVANAATATFIMSGGTVYGSSEGVNSNTATSQGATFFRETSGNAYWGYGVYWRIVGFAFSGPTTNATTSILGAYTDLTIKASMTTPP
jgi:hypothetical protein